MIATSRKIDKIPEANSVERKERYLRDLMRDMGACWLPIRAALSAYLALIATQELGRRAFCVMGLSPSVSEYQRIEGAKLAATHDFNFRSLETAELENPDYRANPSNRCYFCKSELYSKLSIFASENQVLHVVDGTNADDVRDHRPGRVAADENGVRSPMIEAGMTKEEIRVLSKRHGLFTWDKPASPCLASRIEHGVPVTIERLSKVEKGEQILRDFGFREFRVRIHGDLARLEISRDEMDSVLHLELTDKIASDFRELGFRYVTLDLEGFRSGDESR